MSHSQNEAGGEIGASHPFLTIRKWPTSDQLKNGGTLSLDFEKWKLRATFASDAYPGFLTLKN
jgi:hypothetical protein